MLRCRKCLATVALIAAVGGCGSEEPSVPQQPGTVASPDAPVNAADAARQQFGDFSFAIPDGWSRVAPDRTKTKAMILLDGTDWQTAKGMIKVDVGKPAFPTARETAMAFTKRTGGKLWSDKLDFDGEIGTEITTSSTDLSTPCAIVIIYRNQKVYLVMAAAVEGVDSSAALEHMRSTWKWER